MSTAGVVLFGAAWAFQILAWLRRIEKFWAPLLFIVPNTVMAMTDVLSHDAAGAIFFTANAVIMALVVWFWWRRRKRRRAPRTLGAKSRARIAAMVTRMRERPSRPVLRPVPGGAR